MKDEVRTHLHDILQAGKAIKTFTSGRAFKDYATDEFLRSAVERKFQVIGEALVRLKNDAPELLDQIREHRAIISFRNILVHGYDSIDDQTVWDIIEEDLDSLLGDVKKLLR
jgi:uncharacterized protein with HEPN domain